MNKNEKEFWGDTPQHTIDFANKMCAENRARMAREAMGDFGQPLEIVSQSTPETKANLNQLFNEKPC